jgi:hypothetical protein
MKASNTGKGGQIANRTLAIVCAAMTFAGLHPGLAQTVLRLPEREGPPVLISTVDWYKPPARDPENFPPAQRAFIYPELVQVVPVKLRREAAARLANAEILELTRDQARYFGFRVEADTALRSVIQGETKEIHTYQKHSEELKARGSPSLSADQIKRDIRIGEELIKENVGVIRQYEEWMGRLKPYLIRAVGLFDEQNFDGYLISHDLILYFGTTPRPGQRLAMKRMPAVAYLPIKPQRVFTYMSNL